MPAIADPAKTHGHADPHVVDSAFRRLYRIRDARVKAKSREKELVQERRELEGRLDDLGAGDSPQHLKVSRRLVVVLRAIDFVRDQQKSLADKFESTLDAAQQGSLFQDDEDISFKDPAESELFRPDDHDPDQMELDDGDEEGKPAKRKAKPVPAAASGAPVGVRALEYTGWRAELRDDERDIAVLTQHGVSDRAVATLRRHGITELRSLAAPLPSATPGTFGRLTTLDGITPGDEAAIESALQALGREEEKAEMDQLAGRAFAGLKFPGRFHLIPINAKGAWIESKATDITAGDSERLIYAVTEAFGQGVELVGGRIVADGKEVGVVVRKGDPQPETKPRGRKPAKAK